MCLLNKTFFNENRKNRKKDDKKFKTRDKKIVNYEEEKNGIYLI